MKEGFLNIDKKVVGEEIEILKHNHSPKNVLQLQIRLAEEMAERNYGKMDFTDEATREKIMRDWTSADQDGKDSMSSAFRLLIGNPLMKNHPRLKGFGNDLNVLTLADVEYYRKENSLPPN